MLRLRGSVMACPVERPDAAERSVLEALAKGKTDKARRKVASMRLETAARPQLPLLSALADFADGRDPAGVALLALLDPAVPAHNQVRAELAALAGDACKAAGLYDAVPVPLVQSLRLQQRKDSLGEECLDAMARQVESRWAEGDFAGLRGLADRVPDSLRNDPRVARASLPAAVLAGDAPQARALADRLAGRDRERFGAFASALELEPSLRLSYLKAGGEALLKDPLGQALMARTLDEWLVGNMPDEFRSAWNAPALSQRDLALLLCLHFPALKGGGVPGIELPAAVLDDPQADCLAALLSQGFLADYRPEAPAVMENSLQALEQALEATGLVAPCGHGRDAWVRCGLLPGSWGEGPPSGQQWSALAHRARGDLP